MKWPDDILEDEDEEFEALKEMDIDFDDYLPYPNNRDTKDPEETIKEAIKEADKAQTDAYLLHLFNRNKREWIYFRLANSQKLTDANMDFIYNLIDSILLVSSGGEEPNPDYFESGLEDQLFIEDVVTFLLKEKHDDQAFTILSYFLTQVSKQYWSSNDFALVDLTDYFEPLWRDLLSDGKDEIKRRAFLYLMKLEEDTDKNNALKETITNLLLYLVYDKDSETEKYDLYKKALKKLENKDNDYRYDRLLGYYLVYLKEQPSRKEEYEELLKKVERDPEFLIDVTQIYCRERNDFETALIFIDKVISLYNPSSRHYASALYIKTDILKGLHRDEERKQLIQQVLIDYTDAPSTVYHEYKKYFSHEEWEEEKKRILPLLKNHRFAKKFYAEEGMDK